VRSQLATDETRIACESDGLERRPSGLRDDSLNGQNVSIAGLWTDQQTIGLEPDLCLDIGPVREIKERSLMEHESLEPKAIGQVHEQAHCRPRAECGGAFAEAYKLVEVKSGCSPLPITCRERIAGSWVRARSARLSKQDRERDHDQETQSLQHP
jgi:hypothetical protein